MDFLSNSVQGAYNPEYDQKSAIGRSIPIRIQIQHEKDMHEKEMQRLNAMLELIEANPAIEQFINLQRGYIG